MSVRKLGSMASGKLPICPSTCQFFVCSNTKIHEQTSVNKGALEKEETVVSGQVKLIVKLTSSRLGGDSKH